jgi:threonine/homoserine/homoserine lactone efflux protein
MIEAVLFGGGFAFAACVQPGPLQAFLLTSVARSGWKRTLPAAFAPLVSDGPIAVLAMLVLRRLSPELARALQVAGGVLLLALAAAAIRQWRRGGADGGPAGASGPQTLAQAVAVNVLNPAPYLGWTLVLGPATVRAWSQTPSHAVALVVAFYVTLVVTLALTILLFGTTTILGPRGLRALLLVSALTLAALGVYQLAVCLRGPLQGPG